MGSFPTRCKFCGVLYNFGSETSCFSSNAAELKIGRAGNDTIVIMATLRIAAMTGPTERIRNPRKTMMTMMKRMSPGDRDTNPGPDEGPEMKTMREGRNQGQENRKNLEAKGRSGLLRMMDQDQRSRSLAAIRTKIK